MIRTLLGAFVVLALSLGSCLMAQDDPAHIDATKEFLKYWKKSKEESMQVEAIKTLKGNECRLAAEELLKLLKHPNGVVQQTALDILGTYNSR